MSSSSAIPLSSQQIESGQFPVLGSGLWGSVLNVGDGSVLKLARKKCVGIGDGQVKIQREVSVLRAIAATNCQQDLITANVLGWGERQVKTLSAQDDRALWLHTSRVPGIARTVR
ncbi:MAG: hypothetical protein AAFQ63_22365 [Cyanobacteria bacterium J06621_11]